MSQGVRSELVCMGELAPRPQHTRTHTRVRPQGQPAHRDAQTPAPHAARTGRRGPSPQPGRLLRLLTSQRCQPARSSSCARPWLSFTCKRRARVRPFGAAKRAGVQLRSGSARPAEPPGGAPASRFSPHSLLP